MNEWTEILLDLLAFIMTQSINLNANTTKFLPFLDALDPNHPGCPRLVSIEGNKALVSGADGNPGCLTGNGTPWNLEGKVEGDNIFIDFSPKGGPKDFTGVWEDGKNPGIRFPDGNKWSLQAK